MNAAFYIMLDVVMLGAFMSSVVAPNLRGSYFKPFYARKTRAEVVSLAIFAAV